MLSLAQLLFTAGVLASSSGNAEILRHLVEAHGLDVTSTEKSLACLLCEPAGAHREMLLVYGGSELWHEPVHLSISEAAESIEVVRYLVSLGFGFRLPFEVCLSILLSSCDCQSPRHDS